VQKEIYPASGLKPPKMRNCKTGFKAFFLEKKSTEIAGSHGFLH
jgi:hypothetical protein